MAKAELQETKNRVLEVGVDEEGLTSKGQHEGILGVMKLCYLLIVVVVTEL